MVKERALPKGNLQGLGVGGLAGLTPQEKTEFLKRASVLYIVRREFKGQQGPRASERKSASERGSERVSEREGFQRFLRGF